MGQVLVGIIIVTVLDFLCLRDVNGKFLEITWLAIWRVGVLVKLVHQVGKKIFWPFESRTKEESGMPLKKRNLLN